MLEMEQHKQPQEVEGVDGIVERLPKLFTISCASKRNSGKTVLITQLIKKLLEETRIDMVLVMSGSAGLNNDYNFLPKGLVMPYSEEILSRLWARQKAVPQDRRQTVLVVLDDCLATPEAIRSELLTRIYALGRHVCISCIIISQVELRHHTVEQVEPAAVGEPVDVYDEHR